VKKEEKSLNEQDIDIMREWIKSGLIIDDAVAESGGKHL